MDWLAFCVGCLSSIETFTLEESFLVSSDIFSKYGRDSSFHFTVYDAESLEFCMFTAILCIFLWSFFYQLYRQLMRVPSETSCQDSHSKYHLF